MSEQLEPLATEAGQLAIVRAINNLSSLEYAVRAEHAATEAALSADEALTSATNASNSETKARDWAEKTNGAVETETIVTPPETEGDPPTEELVSYFSAKYWALMAEDYFSQMTFDTVPTEDSTNGITSGAVYDALESKQDTLTFDNAPTQNSVNPVKSGGVYSALDTKADKSTTYTKTEVDTALSNVQGQLTFDSTPTANSTNPVTSGGIYTALQNVNIDIDDEITEDSDNPVTSAAIYAALQDLPTGDGDTITTYPDYSRAKSIALSGYITQAGQTYIAEGDGYVTFCIESHITGWSIYVDVNNVLVYYKWIESSKYRDNPFFAVSKGDVVKVYGNNPTQNQLGTIDGAYFIPAKEALLSEQMYSNVLYENSSGVTSGTITLNDDLNNYDFAIFHLLPTGWQGGTFSYIMDTKNITGISIGVNTETYMFFTTNGTTATISKQKNIKLVKVIGYKLAKGGYSGIVSDARMTVKSGTAIFPAMSSNQSYSQQVVFDSPMPDANYNVLVCKGIGKPYDTQYWEQVDNASKTANGFTITGWCGHDIEAGLGINWIAIRPNSYTREGMVEDVLFGNSSGVTSGTINLSGNISDYDLIQIYAIATSSSSGSVLWTYSSSTLLDAQTNDRFVGVYGFDNRYLSFKVVSDNSLRLDSSYNEYRIYEITGIKFGRYVGNVAIDSTVTLNGTGLVTSGAVYDALQNLPTGTGDVTTDTNQNITGTKTFVGSKKVAFKQSTTNDKLGFTLYGNTGTERGYLEFNPTNTVDGVAGLMTLGNYATSAASLTQVGFRRYSNISGASGAYNLLMPMVADARTPFSLTTTYQNFYLPLGFTDGTTTVKTAKSGVVDLSPLLLAALNSITNANGVSY